MILLEDSSDLKQILAVNLIAMMEASLEFGGSISPFQDMESESILPITNISADTSSSSCTSINGGDYFKSRFQW